MQGYYWTDGSLFSFSDFEDLDTVAKHVLNTSYATPRFASFTLYQSYVTQMKQKLKILEMFNNTQVTSNNVCVVLILTLITKPIWHHISCNQTLPNNYFLCELKVSSINATTYYRHKHQCHKLYTYYGEKCWLIQYNRTRTVSSLALHPTLYTMLSAWAYGNPARNHIQIYFSFKKRPICMSTNGLPNHFGKEWLTYRCKERDVRVESYTLGHVHPRTYTHICNEITHFRCRNNICILSSYVCDGFDDCSDKSDEHNGICSRSDIQGEECEDFQFQCKSGRCIHATEQCDYQQQCGDGSDELYCLYNQPGEYNGDFNIDTIEPYLLTVIRTLYRCTVPICNTYSARF